MLFTPNDDWVNCQNVEQIWQNQWFCLAYPIQLCDCVQGNLFQEHSETAIEDCSKAIELEPNYVKALLRRAQLYEFTEKLDESLADFKKILEIDPSHAESISACQVSCYNWIAHFEK